MKLVIAALLGPLLAQVGEPATDPAPSSEQETDVATEQPPAEAATDGEGAPPEAPPQSTAQSDVAAAPGSETNQAPPQKPRPTAEPPAAEPATPKPESAAVAPPPPAASDDSDPTHGHILDATGYLLPGRTAELGLFHMGYGITNWLNVGTYPLAWVAGPIIGGLMGNLSLKLGTPITRWVNVGLEANATWARVKNEGTYVKGLVLPITLGVSLNASESQNYSLAGRYVSVHGTDQSDLESQQVEGGAITRMTQIIAHARWRVSDTVAIYARGYVQPWAQNLKVDSDVQVDEQTSVAIEGEASPTEDTTPWSALAGVHFRWGIVNLRLGVGYGYYFVPRISVPLFKSVFPDLDFYARF